MRKFIYARVWMIFRQQEHVDHGLVALTVDRDPAGHLGDVIEIEGEHLVGVFQAAEMYHLDVGKVLIAAVAQARADLVGAGDAEIVLG